MKRLKYFKVCTGLIRTDEHLAGKHLVHASIGWSKLLEGFRYTVFNDQDKMVGFGKENTLALAKKKVKRRFIELGVVFNQEKRKLHD